MKKMIPKKNSSYHIRGLSKETKLIAILQYSKVDITFRDKFGIPLEGWKPEIIKIKQHNRLDWTKKNKWWDLLTNDIKKYKNYEDSLKEIKNLLDCTDNEMQRIEDYLISGGQALFSPIPPSLRLMIKRTEDRHNHKVWLRVDGLTTKQILYEVDKNKDLITNATKTKKIKRSEQRILIYQRIYDMFEKGMEEKDVLKELKLLHNIYAANDPSPKYLKIDNLRQIYSRYRKNFKKYSF